MPVRKTVKWAVIGLVVLGTVGLAVRAYRSLGGPALQPWHTFVPVELRAPDLDGADWARYVAQEDAIFKSVRAEVSQKLEPDARVPINRYFEGSPVYPARFQHDWNRSYILEPDGKPAGAVLLLHGLTDSPYSLRHIARLYRDRGFVVIGMRMPGHGTVPAGLSDVLQEQLAHGRLAGASRRQQRRVPRHSVDVVHVRPCLKQQFGHRDRATPDGPHQRRVSAFPALQGQCQGIHFRSIRNEHSAGIEVAPECGQVERRHLLSHRGHHALIDQHVAPGIHTHL